MRIEDRAPIEKRHLALKNEAQSWHPGWRDIQRFINPTRGFFYEAIPNWGRAIDHKSQLSGLPNRAVRTMAAGMRSGLASPSRPWFKLGLANKDLMEYAPVKEWLEGEQDRMMAVFAKSNVYGGLHNVYEEIGTFGTAAALGLEDYNTVIRLRNFTCGEYFIGHDESQRVNSFGRYYAMTVGQLVAEFGIDNVSPQTRSQYKNGNVDPWVRVCHLIEPNDDRIEEKKDYLNMPYRSVSWEFGQPPGECLRVSGYEDFPVFAPRWQQTTTSFVYGWGPGHYALGDVKSFMQMKKDFLVAMAKVNNPPLQVDSSVITEANTLPGGITRSSMANPNGGVRPAYQINPDLQHMAAAMESLKEEINETFFVNLFTMLANNDSGQMTAYEVAKRYEEKLNLLGPVIEHLESELHNPLIQRTFALMQRAHLGPPPPMEVQGQELKIEYVSMLAQAQKMVGTLAIERTVAFAGSMIGAFPEIVDVIDADEAVEKYAELEGGPPEMIRTKEEILARRQDRAKQQQAAQVAANAQAMVDGAKTLSETKVGQGSVLDSMVGTPQQGAAA